MTKFDDQLMEARKAFIFDHGAQSEEAKVPVELGSNERCTWYDGYASTHPEFKNPYRLAR